MSWKDYLLISLVSLVVLGGFAWFQSSPGYMDAEYYYSMGLRIANDGSFREPFIWNFLNDPGGLDQPGFLFWNPLPALIAAGGIYLVGAKSFLGSKLLFLALAAAVPSLVMKLAWDATQKLEISRLAGWLAVFPFLYTPFLGTTDSFGVLMVLGSGYFLLLPKLETRWRAVLLGTLCGLFHLARADGAIWLAAAGIFIWLGAGRRGERLLLLISGYLAVMLPWFARNWLAVGQILPASSSRMLWLTTYNDLFNLNAATLTPERWLAQGWGSIAGGIGAAFWANLKSLAVVQGEILLLPLLLFGLSKDRDRTDVRAGLLVWCLILFVMTVLFPYAGMRGGFFHSGAGLQPLIWVLAARGMAAFVDWGVKQRAWNEKRAWILFGSALVSFMALLTGFTLSNRVIGSDFKQPIWNASFLEHRQIAQEIDRLDGSGQALVMLNNPPGYYAATGRSAVAIPNGPIADLKMAAARFGARYLILDPNHPRDLAGLYAEPDQEKGLIYLGTANGKHYFLFPE